MSRHEFLGASCLDEAVEGVRARRLGNTYLRKQRKIFDRRVDTAVDTEAQ